MPDKTLPMDLIITPALPGFVATGLKQTSIIRAHKLALLHKSLVQSNLGKLDDVLIENRNDCLKIAMGIDH